MLFSTKVSCTLHISCFAFTLDIWLCDYGNFVLIFQYLISLANLAAQEIAYPNFAKKFVSPVIPIGEKCVSDSA